MISAIRLPSLLQRRLSAYIDYLLNGRPNGGIDFSCPRGAEALMSANSVSWRIFKNPIALFVGGTAAVILELAQPAVRAGVWEHSSFRKKPFARLQRTGLAAMITVYGARLVAESMIHRVVRMHDSVQGMTPKGIHYSANDPQLLTWVHATAAYGFAAAYDRYVAGLEEADFGRLYCEGEPVARLYGANAPPRCRGEMQTLFEGMLPKLEPSPIVFDFLSTMRTTPALPPSLRWMQTFLGRAYGLQRHERWLVELAGAAADRIVLPTSPAVQSCIRLGLSTTYLYSQRRYAGARRSQDLDY